MKEISAVHFEPPGAELPVRTQQEVKPEEAMIFFIEHAPAHQTEVGHVFFLFPGVNTTPAWAAAKLPGNRSEVRPGGGAIPKTAHAGPKNGPKNAVVLHRACAGSPDRSRPCILLVSGSKHEEY